MIDLRSDTISMPTKDMLASVLEAKLGDDGRVGANNKGEDLSVIELENLAASLTGKEDAIFMASGTMGNTCGVLSWCKPGSKIAVHESQHLYVSEKVLFEDDYFRMQPVTYDFDESMQPDIAELEASLKKGDISLVCIENTHNNSGGFCISLKRMQEIKDLCIKYNIPLHMDGARLVHAAAALDCTLAELAQYADTVMFCVSKGLGAPIGSLLCGPKEQIVKARAVRRLLGGSMRQAGVAAAPGIYALENNIPLMKNDIINAKTAAEIMRSAVTKVKIQDPIPSNIVMIDLSKTSISPKAFCEIAKAKGLLIGQVLDTPVVRMVFYKDISLEEAKTAASIIIDIDKNL